MRVSAGRNNILFRHIYPAHRHIGFIVDHYRRLEKTPRKLAASVA